MMHYDHLYVKISTVTHKKKYHLQSLSNGFFLATKIKMFCFVVELMHIKNSVHLDLFAYATMTTQ